LIDTAEIYGLGRSEKIVGDAIRGRREEVFLATKLFRSGSPSRFSAALRPALGGWVFLTSTSTSCLAEPSVPSWLDDGAHRPAARLGLSWPRRSKQPLAGAVVGRRTRPGWPVLSNQVRFSLIERGPDQELVAVGAAGGRVIIAYSPLGQGLLSGKYQTSVPRNFRRGRRAFSAESRQRLQPLSIAG